MSDKHLIRSMQIPPIQMQRYERYLPTSFDESMSILEKINKVILYLHEYSKITEEMLGKWNEVYRWVMNEGLDDTVGERLREWLENGTFDRIINENIFNELNGKVNNIERSLEELENDFDGFNVELEKVVNEISKVSNNVNKLNVELGKTNEEVYSLGLTKFFRK